MCRFANCVRDLCRGDPCRLATWPFTLQGGNPCRLQTGRNAGRSLPEIGLLDRTAANDQVSWFYLPRGRACLGHP